MTLHATRTTTCFQRPGGIAFPESRQNGSLVVSSGAGSKSSWRNCLRLALGRCWRHPLQQKQLMKLTGAGPLREEGVGQRPRSQVTVGDRRGPTDGRDGAGRWPLAQREPTGARVRVSVRAVVTPPLGQDQQRILQTRPLPARRHFHSVSRLAQVQLSGNSARKR